MIDIDNVRFTYDGVHFALDGVSAHVETGEFLCILGGNGSGKSTLAKHLNALLVPDEGRVVVDGMDTADAECTYAVRKTCGMVFQNPDDQLVASLVEDDVAFGPENLGIPTPELRERVTQALEDVGLSGFERHETHALSGGQKQRVAIAGVLAMNPSVLVLDEADRMLDMGFADDILTIVKQMPESRQTILFSATMPPKIAELARSVMHDPVEVEIAVSKPAENIQQSLYICHEGDKPLILKKVFKEQPPQRVILFCSSKQKVKELAIILKRQGLNARAMHSDLEQAERDEVMNLFRAHKIDLLVATDIVARGIDIDDITMVINYDAPHDAEDYVHRIGRTARAGREGRAITLIGEKDLYALSNIERTLKIKIPRAELPEGVRPPQTEAQHGRGGRGRNGRGGNSNGRRRSNGNKEEGKKETDSKNRNQQGGGGGRDNRQRNSQRNNGKPHGKNDNRPANKQRPPKSGAGRKPE